MLSLATKSLLGLSAAVLVAALVYGVATSEGSGAAVLASVGLAAFALALITLPAGPDRTPVPDAGPIPQNAPAGGRPVFPSIWPFAGALAVGFAALGAATSAAVVVPAILIAVVVLLGWLFQAWTEHPVFTARFGARLSDRLLVPVGLPVGVFALVAIIALSLSRVLLAVSVQGSRVIALVVAVAILGSAFFIVAQERMARAALNLLCAFAFVAVLAAGIAGTANGERTFETKVGNAPLAAPVSISASGVLSFNVDSLTFPADHVVPLAFDNQTAGVPHNFAIYDRQGGHELFAGGLLLGPKKATYKVPALAAGTYYFQCDVHTNMHGTLTVTSAPSGTSAAATATSTTVPPTTTTTEAVTAGFATTATTSAPTSSGTP